MESIYYMNPALGYPYGSSLPRTASGLSTYCAPRTNPMEEAYHYALRILEDSYRRELDLLYHLCIPYGDMKAYCRREHDIQSRYYYERDRLESDFTRSSQQYYYGYVNSSYRTLNDSYYSIQQSQLDILKYSMNMPIYYNSKETTSVPTETKSYIITDSDPDRETYYADGVGFPDYKTLAEAEKEAQNLARENPDNEYTIYQTVKKYKVADTPLDTTVFV